MGSGFLLCNNRLWFLLLLLFLRWFLLLLLLLLGCLLGLLLLLFKGLVLLQELGLPHFQIGTGALGDHGNILDGD